MWFLVAAVSVVCFLCLLYFLLIVITQVDTNLGSQATWKDYFIEAHRQVGYMLSKSGK